MESIAIGNIPSVTNSNTSSNSTSTANPNPIPIAVSSNSSNEISDLDNANDDGGLAIGQQGSNTQKQRGSNWTVAEDLKLVKSWCDILSDPVKDADKKEKLWKRILEDFEATGNPNARDWMALKNRWAIISKTCSTFSADVDLAQEEKTADDMDDDVVARALKIYKSHPPKGTGKKFMNIHCWYILKNQLQWHVFLDKKRNHPEDTGKMLRKYNRQRLNNISEESVTMKMRLMRGGIKFERYELEAEQRATKDAELDREIKIMERDISTYTGARYKFYKNLLAGIMKKCFNDE